MLKYVVWADRCSVKRSSGMTPFELVYGREVILPLHLITLVQKILQRNNEEPNNMTRIINRIIQIHQKREQLDESTQQYHEKMTSLFDKRAKEITFMPRDLIIKWDKKRKT